MNLEILMDLGSAALALLLAIGAAVRARRSIDRWAFALGMAMVAADRLVSGLMARDLSAHAAYQWQMWRLTALSAIPGPWLLFSLSYARGNARAFISHWKFPLAFTFVSRSWRPSF